MKSKAATDGDGVGEASWLGVPEKLWMEGKNSQANI